MIFALFWNFKSTFAMTEGKDINVRSKKKDSFVLKDLHRSHMVGPVVGRCTAATRFLAIYHGVSRSARRRTIVSRWVAHKMKDPSRLKNWYLRFTVRPCICLPTVCHLGKTHSPKPNNTKAHRKGFAVQAAGDERSEVDLGHWSQRAPSIHDSE